MTTTVVPSKRNRASNWEAEFYKNGYPKEIIVIEDTSPADQPSQPLGYTVVPGPTPPHEPSFVRKPLPKRSFYDSPPPAQRLPPPPPDSFSMSTLLPHTDTNGFVHKKRRKQYPGLGYVRSCYEPTMTNTTTVVAAAAAAAATSTLGQPLHETVTAAAAAALTDQEGHFIVRPGEFLKNRYQMHEMLGQGTYGKVVRCYDHVRRGYCAIKIIRAIPKYREASQTEIRILNTLKEHDQLNFNQCIHLLEWFEHHNHICMVFELLDQSIYDFLKGNNFEPFPISQIQHFAKQLLNSVAFMHELKMIHTDLKPENILLKDNEATDVPSLSAKSGSVRVLHNTDIMLIDFGSATFEDDYHSSVVSTRHYRAPEIILGLGWSYPCDLWSIGCILVELFTGDALFHTHDNLEHLAMMESVLGKIPVKMARAVSSEACAYFKNGRLTYPGPNTSLQSQKSVKALKSLKYTIQPRTQANNALVDLLQKLLTYDPAKRITAREALRHFFFRIEFDEYGREIEGG
ncbi:kinase-like domain-containing protein [Dichotomocladium elegans]|nr:kinase-like domain-containing protein [Dichotomocladium elegans]